MGDDGGDERYLVVRGRRWRRQDPDLPEDDPAAHRRRVDLAKHGLGERGEPWWEQTPTEKRARWSGALAALEALDAEG